MASGQIFGLNLSLPGTSYALLRTLIGTSTPAEAMPILNFPDAASAYADFYGSAEGYGGGGLTLKLKTSALAATNNYVFQAAIRALPDDAEDFDTTAFTYDFNTVTITAPSAVGENSYDNITFTDGADMDSLANSQGFVLRLLRDPAHGSDNLANTAQLWLPSLILMET